jgi:ABC-type sugar transport system permease subunit
MKERIENTIKQLSTWQQQTLFATPFHILLVVAVAVLFIAAFLASFTSNEGSSSITKLKVYLKALLKSDFTTLRAEDEVVQLEKLINHVKTSSSRQVISRDHELWALLAVVCEKVNFVLQQGELPGRSNWRLFSAIAQEFCTVYAPEKEHCYLNYYS